MTLREVIAHARLGELQRDGQGRAVIEFRFGASEPFFTGHFPEKPILPGVFQLEIARAAAEWELQKPLAIRAVRKAKFLRPVRPNEIVRMSLKLSEVDDGFLAHARFAVGVDAVGETQMQLVADASNS